MLETLRSWALGDLTQDERIWLALAPALGLFAWMLVGLVAYTVRTRLFGRYRDAEIESRGSSRVLGMWIRQYFIWLIGPFWRLLLRTGIPANAVTTLSLLLALAAGISCAAGRFALGGWLFLFSGVLDIMDGRLARAQGQDGPAGAVLDSFLDRYNDAAMMVGLAWFYRDSWVLLAVLSALVGSSAVSYIKARGESLGVKTTAGMMQRPERIVYLGFAVALSPIFEALLEPANTHPVHRLAVAGIVLLAVSTHTTALRRFLDILGKLEGKQDRRWLRSSPATFTKHMVSSGVATGADLALVVALVELSGLSPALATAVGCVLGAVINYSINRTWTYQRTGDPALPQMGRYTFVSATSAALNAGAVAILLLLPAIAYPVAWLAVRAAVLVTWNFPLHRHYVFAPESDVDSRRYATSKT